MEGRTFSWQPLPENPRLFEAEDMQPTKHQVKSDRVAREHRRAEAKRQLLATGDQMDALAVRMQPMGYGIDAIHRATGVQRDLLRKLVLGE